MVVECCLQMTDNYISMKVGSGRWGVSNLDRNERRCPIVEGCCDSTNVDSYGLCNTDFLFQYNGVTELTDKVLCVGC